MTRALSNQEACAHVTSFLKNSFAPDVRFELTRESDTVYRVRATSNIDASITEGLENMPRRQVALSRWRRRDREDG